MELTSKEKHTYNIIGKVINGDITRKEAMFELNKSRQQIYRLINIYYTEGVKGVIHKNRGRIPYNKKAHLLIDELKQLYLNEYYDFNLVAFYDELNEKDNNKPMERKIVVPPTNHSWRKNMMLR